MEKSKIFEVSSFGLAKGKKLVSEDFALVRVIDDLCIGIVCDGVGSAEKGGEAAKRCATYLINNFKLKPKSWSIEKSLKHFISNINTILYKAGMEEYERSEYVTTLSIVVIDANRLYGANVGDSPIFLFRDNHLQELSFSHSMDEEGMEHVLTQAIGLSSEVEPYFFENNLEIGDILLLTSDGLEKVLNKDEIKDNIKNGASLLVKTASKKVNDNLPDDTTAVVIEIKAESKRSTLKKIDLEIPQTLKKDEIIDGYKLIKPLIQNNRTWLVENKGIKYVLKFPPVEAIDDERYLDLYVKEAWNASRLKAGFFPKAVIPKNRTKRYYVMEYLDGMTLKEYISKKPLPIEEAINLAKFLLRACSFLLKYDLVHGDIKPENIILLNRRGKIVFKLIDYGSITEIFSDTSRAGTPSYLAPERFLNEPISEQTEIFAIGVTLYEALTKKLPFGEIEPFQTPTFKTPKPIKKFNPAVADWLESIILRAIEIDKFRRYEVYSEMEFELNNPSKVKPYFPKNVSLIESNPEKFYKIAFFISFFVNVVFIVLLLKR